MTALDVAGIDVLEHRYILKVTAGTGGNVEDKRGIQEEQSSHLKC